MSNAPDLTKDLTGFFKTCQVFLFIPYFRTNGRNTKLRLFTTLGLISELPSELLVATMLTACNPNRESVAEVASCPVRHH